MTHKTKPTFGQKFLWHSRRKSKAGMELNSYPDIQKDHALSVELILTPSKTFCRVHIPWNIPLGNNITLMPIMLAKYHVDPKRATSTHIVP